jgi:NodT family efflux transporter outer membrane factor (OMF) lipoprotein
MRRELALTLPALLMVLTAGCAGMHGIAPRTRAVNPADLAAVKAFAAETVNDGAWPAREWWKRFGDPQLDRLESEALAANPTLAMAESRVDRAVALASVERAAGRPAGDGTLGVTRPRYGEHDIVPTPPAGSWKTASRLAFEFGYELDFWHKHRAAIAAALSRAEAARVDAFEARLVLSVAVAKSYVELERLDEQLDVAHETLAQRQRILDLTRQRVAAGIDSRVELAQAEGALPATRVDIAVLDEAVVLVRHALAALLGQGPDRGLAITRPRLDADNAALALPSSMPADLLGRRPDVLASRLRVQAAAADVRVAKAAFYPNIDLLAFAGFSSIGLSEFVDAGSRVAGVGPAFRLPLFDRKALRGRLAARDADYDAAVEQYDETLIDALRDTSDRLASLHAVADQRAKQRLALDDAQQAYELALMRYRDGVSSYLSVLSAETEVLQRRRRAVDLRARDFDSRIELIRALGGGFDGDAGSSSSPSTSSSSPST